MINVCILLVVLASATFAHEDLDGEHIMELLEECSFENPSFLDHRDANRFEFFADIPLPQTDLTSAKIAYERLTDVEDELFWMRWLTKESFFNATDNTVEVKDDIMTHVTRHYQFDSANDCSVSGTSALKNDDDSGCRVKFDTATFLHEIEEDGGKEYEIAIGVFNCHLNLRDAELEKCACSTFEALWTNLDDKVIACIAAIPDDTEECEKLMD